MAAIFSAVLLIGGPAIYRLIGGSGDILAAALEYSNALFSGALAYWVLSTLTSVVRGAGHAAVLAVVYVAAEALHIVLVPALMFGIGPLPALGIAGPASPRSRRSAHRALRSPGMSRRGGPPSRCRGATCG